MPLTTVKFHYERRSPLGMLLRIAKYELDEIDRFLSLAKKAHRSEQNILERLAARTGGNTPDEWLVDDFAQLQDFSALSGEFAVLGLWRCIELYRKRAVRVASGAVAAAKIFKHAEFMKDLARLGITEKRIRCARSVDELRCLNNSIKHERYVDGKLADFPRWRGKKGCELGSLEHHYQRLRPAADRYLSDLANRLARSTPTPPPTAPRPPVGVVTVRLA